MASEIEDDEAARSSPRWRNAAFPADAAGLDATVSELIRAPGRLPLMMTPPTRSPRMAEKLTSFERVKTPSAGHMGRR